MVLNLISDVVKLAVGGAASVIGANNQSNLMDAYDKLRVLTSSTSSISKKAKNSIFQFPFIISNNITNLDTIVHLVKANEIEYSKFILLTMGLNPMLSGQDNYEITRALSNIHTNDPKLDVVRESVNFDIEKRSVNEIMKGKKKITTEGGAAVVSTQHANKVKDVNEVISSAPANLSIDKDHVGDIAKAPIQTEAIVTPMPDYRTPSPSDYGNTPANTTSPQTNTRDAVINVKNMSDKVFEKYSSIYNMTMIQVAFKTGNNTSDISIPLGIRGVPHIVPSEEARYLIESVLQSKKPIARFIQWRSGEIKFWRDLVFRMDTIKKDTDMMKRINGSDSWLYVLKSRKAAEKANNILSVFRAGETADKRLPILPNCTVILTIEDIDIIEKKTGVNLLTNPNMAKNLMDDAMLLGLIIVDTSSDVVHTLYSGYNKYSLHPVSAIKSGNKKEGDSTNILLDLMKKI